MIVTLVITELMSDGQWHNENGIEAAKGTGARPECLRVLHHDVYDER